VFQKFRTWKWQAHHHEPQLGPAKVIIIYINKHYTTKPKLTESQAMREEKANSSM